MEQTKFQRFKKLFNKKSPIRFFLLFMLAFLVTSTFYIVFGNPVPTENYRADNWAQMSIGIGASVLTLVAIITAVVLSNENSRRVEFIEGLSANIQKLEEKERLNPDRSYDQVYDNSKEKIQEVIESIPPLRYRESGIGIFSFYLFLGSAFFAVIGTGFQLILALFLYGISLVLGYVLYVAEEFQTMDRFSKSKKKDGSLSLLATRVNGVLQNLTVTNQRATLNMNGRINIIEFKIRFKGTIKNGFLHAIVKYANGLTSHIPEANTYLANFGFANNYYLVLLEKEFDTGILQSKGTHDFTFELVLRSEKGSEVNPLIATAFVERLGEQQIFRNPSVENDNRIVAIEIRMYEDPFYKSNYKRREVACITIEVNEQVAHPMVNP